MKTTEDIKFLEKVCRINMASNSGFQVGQKLGFIGVGTMNSAIIKGILKVYKSESNLEHFSVPIYVSPRGKVKSEALKEEYGHDLIKVCNDNQDVLRKADVIFLGVRPEQVITDYHSNIIENIFIGYFSKVSLKIILLPS